MHVSVHNLKIAWPTKISMPFLSSLASWNKMHIWFFRVFQIYDRAQNILILGRRWSTPLCIRQRKPWTPPPQGSTQIRRRDDVESWGVYFQGLVNLDLINFLTMWIFTLCKFGPGESWTNAVYISSENVLNTKIDCSKNVLLIVVLVGYKLKWMCC